MAKRESAQKRLRRSIEIHRNNPLRLVSKSLVFRFRKSDFEKRARNVRDQLADNRFPSHDELQRAFAAYELDTNDPFDWIVLMGEMASILFPEPRRAGAPKESWTLKNMAYLLDDISILKQKNSRLSTAQACKRLAENAESPAHYRKAGKGLYKAAQRASALQKNRIFRPMFRWLLERRISS